MNKKIFLSEANDTKKLLLKEFKEMCSSRSPWQVWSDVIVAASCAMANSLGPGSDHYEERDDEYKKCIDRLGSVAAPAKIFAYITSALEENPEQDFLGNLFMELDLGSHWKGQFFTPYSICQLMSNLNLDGAKEEIESRGWCSVNDPACGAGATMIATANEMRKAGINFQNHVLFVGQDIDRVVGLMCYLQMSLLGMPGYVVIGNTLTNPVTGRSTLFPNEKEGQEIWLTPMYHSDVWEMRRRCNLMDMLLAGSR